MKVAGIVLIVLALVSGVSSINSLDQKAEDLPAEARTRQKIGSGIATLMFVGAGFYLIRAGERRAAARERQVHEADDADDPFHRRKPKPTGSPGPKPSGGGPGEPT